MYFFDETTEAIVETIASFSQDRIAPLADEVDRTDEFPRHLWPQMGQLGFFGPTVEEEFGGLGLGYTQHVLMAEEVNRASGSVGMSYIVQSNLCINQLRLNGSHEQKAKYLPALLSGQHVGALAMSEPSAGSDVVSMRTTATRKGDHFVLNGGKMWITNGWYADTYIIYAKTEPEAGSKGITAFIVERDFKGFSRAQKLDKLGCRGSGTAELVFENVEVPVENVLGEVNGGARVLMSGLDYERITAASAPLGVMRSCLDVVLPYVHERKQFGQAIGEFQLMQGKLADMYTAYHASRAFVLQVAQAADRGIPVRKEAASAILFTAEKCTQVALDAIQCLGGNGYINDYPTGRFLRDAKLYEIGAGTSEIRRWLIGRELFQESA